MIVITTPTGQIGRQVVERLLNTGEAVRVIARDPSRLPARVRERAEIVQGSHDETDVVAKAFAGADRVFWVVPPAPRTDSVEGHYVGFTRSASEAFADQGVERVVGVSSLGRGFGGKAGHLSAAYAMDDLIESTGVRYRALRMPFFMENLLNQVETIKSRGMFLLPNAADRELPLVATRDVAATAAGLLTDDSWTGQDSVPVVSPDDLSPSGMARVMSDVLERPIRFQQIGHADYKSTMMRYGMSDAWAQALVDMAAAQNEGVYGVTPDTPRAATGFRQWCEDVLKPAFLA